MSHRGALAIITGTVVAAGCLAIAQPAAASTDWGPVVNVWDHGFDHLSSVTTDNGMVVAVWTGPGFRNLWVSVRRVGQNWSSPTKIVTVAASVALAKDGKQAWVVWQNFESVSAFQIGADGTLGSPEVLGTSTDPFSADTRIAAGSNGAVTVTWHTESGLPENLAYRAPGGSWAAAEVVPQGGYVQGLVVGGAGTSHLVMTTSQGISYLRRSAAGTWSSPEVVAATGSLVTVAGNQHGDLVVGWQTDNGDDTYSVHARYRRAQSGFRPTILLTGHAPYYTTVAPAIAADGSVVAAYRTTDSGVSQIQVARTDSDGTWASPETLMLTGSSYRVAMNLAGDFVVTDKNGADLQLVRCPANGTCGATELNSSLGYKYPNSSLGPNATITLVWGRGCHTEECVPTHLVAQRGR